MARRRSDPVRLTWTAGPAPQVPPADLQSQSIVGGRRNPRDGHLIRGDNLPILVQLETELRGQIDLAYLDPPFFTGKTFRARVGFGEDSRRPQDWKTRSGYDDRWPDLGSYLDMLRPRLEAVHRLLAPTGSLYLHLDWRTSAYARVLLDEIFGPDRLLNEIVWIYHGPSPIRTAFSRKHDTILAYTKSARYQFHADQVRIPYDQATRRTFRGSPRAGFGKVPDLERGKVPEDWWYLPVVARLHRERTGYPTQKPMALVERILRASTSEGDLVLDPFAGSGTTLVAANRLNRRWIGCDSAPLAVATSYRRLLLESPRPGFRFSTAGPAPAKSILRDLGVEVSGQVLEARPRSRTRHAWLEADWDYDGRVFRSRDQVVRPWRSETPLPRLTHRFARPGSHRIAFRAADRDGSICLGELTIATEGPDPT